MGFVDLHSHVLCGLDDGSPDLATSIAMIGALSAIGFTEVCATPHQKSGQFLPDLAQVSRTFDTVKERAQQAWDKALGVVEVQGASPDQLVTLLGARELAAGLRRDVAVLIRREAQAKALPRHREHGRRDFYSVERRRASSPPNQPPVS